MLKTKHLEGLTDKEVSFLYEVPAMVSVLIAAADSKIDETETAWAKKVVGYRQEIGDEDLFEYYEMAESVFETTLEGLLTDGKGSQERISQISDTLKKVNPILEKLDLPFANKMLESWRSLAKQVARSTGGFMGFGSISEQEKRLIDLKMIEIKVK